MISFIDLKAQQERIKEDVYHRIHEVLKHGQYILGPEVLELEKELGAYQKATCVSCASGTDALVLSLRALEISKKDAVFVPDFTFAATAEAVVLAGGTPVFVDVQKDTFNICPQSLQEAIESLPKELTPKALIAVDLFGALANYPLLSRITKEYGLTLISDNAQSFGATLMGHRANQWADISTTSFFPAKPLGCYGDGGAIFLSKSHEHLKEIIQSLRVHGQGKSKYDNTRIGYTSRLDTIQAAILLSKFKIFDEEIILRENVAKRYQEGLQVFETQKTLAKSTQVWAQFTLLHPKREKAIKLLQEKKIPTAIYYPTPLSSQPPYLSYPKSPKGTPQTELICQKSLSIPMHPYLDETTQKTIINAVLETL